MTAKRPPPTAGLRHIALFVERYEETLAFYQNLMGMALEWQPDADNSYLCSGNDNLALHRYQGSARDPATQRLDHIGFIIDTMDGVDEWFAFLKTEGVKTLSEPRTHRDGARSFYCLDPDGNTVQIIYHPPISGQQFTRP